MTLTVERIYTPEELLGNSAIDGHELIEGHLRERPVSTQSSWVAGEILGLLREEAKRTREARVYPSDLGYRCFPDMPNTVRFADVSVIRAERDRQITDDPGYMPIPADLVVEVLSPNDVIKDVDEKVDQYLTAGFGTVWVVNPRRRHVHVYRPDGTVQLLSEHEEITAQTALPNFRCKVSAFFDV